MINKIKQNLKYPATAVAKRIPAFAIGFGAYTLGKGFYDFAKEAYPELKDYTTIEPTSKLQGSATGWITKNFDTMRKLKTWSDNYTRGQEPTDALIKTQDLEYTEYGLSQNGLIKYIQKNFTKKGKAAVQDMKLKSIEK